MKFNWGTGIVLAFTAFISFILYFVFVASTDPKANHHMVTEDYYQQELTYQADLNAAANLKAFGGDLRIERTASGLGIRFPEGMEPAKIKGTLSLYRPSNKQLDFETPIQISDTLLLIPESRLLDGRWDIRLDWEYQGTPYLYRGRVTY
ncbi:FixH family protein [Robiginitalea sp. M366]|uniref:FixH family protein n=1 Tax=Robiginitalea aestuariiviva TaxID=3036903 RepID=UPI00240D1FA9|nr:FixH family protein [Robiginitalea aestuariiviva]MDG1571119.1 FixH family protein [Robiginitalea aestuariiviva]